MNYYLKPGVTQILQSILIFTDKQITHLNPLLHCRLLWLSIDEEEHQADDDQRLDQRGKQEDNPHVVAAALSLGLVWGLPCLPAILGLGVAGAVHGCWR